MHKHSTPHGSRTSKDLMELLETPVILQYVAGASLKQMCAKSGLNVEGLMWSYSRNIDSAVLAFDVKPVECGVELIKAPDGNHRLVPSLKWVPLAGRDPDTNNYVWKKANGAAKELGALGKSMLTRKLRVGRPPVAEEFNLYLTCREIYDTPIRMGGYRVVLTVEAMQPEIVREEASHP